MFKQNGYICLGVNEFALRLLPFIAGIATLFFLWLFVRDLIRPVAIQWYLLWMLSFSAAALRYSTEFKQYSVDMAVVLGLIAWAWHSRDKAWTGSRCIMWSLAGASAIWICMPSVFALAAIGIAFSGRIFRHEPSHLFKILIPVICWLNSFALYYYLILRADIGSEYLQQFHAPYFIDLLPRSISQMQKSFEILLGVFRSMVDKSAVSLIFAIASVCLGSIYLIRKQRFLACLLIIPVGLCLLASHLHLFSLLERVALFLVPLLLLLMGTGLTQIIQFKPKWTIPIVGIIALFTIYNQKGLSYFSTRMEFEDSKSTMRYMAGQKQIGEPIFVPADAVPAFVFYNEMYAKAWRLKPFYLASWDKLPSAVIPSLFEVKPAPRNGWIFFSHTFPDTKAKELTDIKSIGSVNLSFETAYSSSVYRFELDKLK